MPRRALQNEEDGACLHQCNLMGVNMLKEPKKAGVTVGM